MSVDVEYQANLFVLPKESHRKVLAKVKNWQRRQAKGLSRALSWGGRAQNAPLAPGDQVLNLVGERGVGKTWLLRYLAELDRRISPSAVYLDLEARFEFPNPQGYADAVEGQIRKKCGNGQAILLLDTVPPHLDPHLRALEDAVLRPHLTRHASLVIMALIYPSQSCWRSPALRGGDILALVPFEEQQTNDQLQRLAKAGAIEDALDIAQVQEHSRGLPLLNYLLATRVESDAFNLLLDYWFSRIPGDERDRVLGYLEAVCTLDILEHVSIERSLEVYYRYWAGVSEHPLHPGGIRNLLRKYWLARPAYNKPGRIVLVDSVRHAVCQILKDRDAELYALLRESAQVTSRGQG